MLPAAEPRPGPTAMPCVSGIIDKIPYDQEIIHIAHALDDAELIVQPLPQAPVGRPGNASQDPSSQSWFRYTPGRHTPPAHRNAGSLVTPNSISTLHRSAIFWVFSMRLRAHRGTAAPSPPRILRNTGRPRSASGSRPPASYPSGYRAGCRGPSQSSA